MASNSAFRTPHSELAWSFLAAILAAEERQFPSVGHGTDFRYRSRSGPSTINSQPADFASTPVRQDTQPSTINHRLLITGSALVHADEVIHAAFFRLDETEQPDRMASFHRRRHYRQ